MSKIGDALWQDYKEIGDLIGSLDNGSERYEAALDERDKIRNELIKLEQIELDREVKMVQIKSEDKREQIRNGITIGTFVVTTGVSLYAIGKTFKFDQVATVTSTLGRNILNGVIPKLMKR